MDRLHAGGAIITAPCGPIGRAIGPIMIMVGRSCWGCRGRRPGGWWGGAPFGEGVTVGRICGGAAVYTTPGRIISGCVGCCIRKYPCGGAACGCVIGLGAI